MDCREKLIGFVTDEIKSLEEYNALQEQQDFLGPSEMAKMSTRNFRVRELEECKKWLESGRVSVSSAGEVMEDGVFKRGVTHG